jgi:hypothetical protein
LHLQDTALIRFFVSPAISGSLEFTILAALLRQKLPGCPLFQPEHIASRTKKRSVAPDGTSEVYGVNNSGSLGDMKLDTIHRHA